MRGISGPIAFCAEHLWRGALFLALALPGISHAAEGNCLPLERFTDSGRTHCIEARAAADMPQLGGPLPPSRVPANQDDPACGDPARAVQELVTQRQRAVEAGRLSGSVVGSFWGQGGALLGTDRGGVATNAAEAGFGQRTPNAASCRDLCVHVPAGARNVIHEAWVSSIPWRENAVGRCLLGRASCLERLAAFDAVRQVRTSDGGTMYCARARNWAPDNPRAAGFRVLYSR